MNYFVVFGLFFVTLIWYVRPVYNFMAKRKYVLLDIKNLSFMRRVQSSLPALTFYTIILVFMYYPAYVNKAINSIETGSILLLQIVFVFLFTRFDKHQSKYKIELDGIRFHRRQIFWKEHYTIKFKRNAFFILHKPRFILKSSTKRIVVPMLSIGITDFIVAIEKSNSKLGLIASEIYQNTRNYYIKNIDLEKQLSKL